MWDFQLEETVVEAFDMIVEEDNVLLVIDIDDYPQKFNEIVKTWRVWIWYQGFKVKFKPSRVRTCPLRSMLLKTRSMPTYAF
jgi:hypothetical protein